MTLTVPLWLNNQPDPPGYTATDDRQLIAALVSEGVIGAADLKVSQRGAGANFSVDVAAGAAAVVGDDVAGQGTYLIRSTAVENVAIPTKPATAGQSRNDLLVAQVRDSNISGSYDDWLLTVVSGAATSGTPVDPALPPTALALARVLVANSATSITNAVITDLRAAARAPGTPNGRYTTAKTDASGYVVVTHYLGYTPRVLIAQGSAPIGGPGTLGQIIVDTLGATTFRARCINAAGTPIANSWVSFYFLGVP